MEIYKLTKDNLEIIRYLYADFVEYAVSDYFFEAPPLPFDYFKENFSSGFIKGYVLTEEFPQAFLLYSDCLNQAVEISLLYTKEHEDDYKIRTAILEKFLFDAKHEYKGKIISYPMLGVQNNFVQDITNLGFNLVGEMIVEMDLLNPISAIFLNKVKTQEIIAPYSIDVWKDEYLDVASQIIQEEFAKLNDAKFDPRFLSVDGTKSIIKEITNGYYGDFNPVYTTVLLCDGVPAGFCFVNFTTNQIANIPLIAISNVHRMKGYGATMLRNSVNLVKKDIVRGITCINATCDTDNFPAARMYRKIGFVEKTYYAHAYANI